MGKKADELAEIKRFSSYILYDISLDKETVVLECVSVPGGVGMLHLFG